MSPERFAEITAAYGASPARWPDAERAAAVAFIAEWKDAVRTDGESYESAQAVASRRVRAAWNEADGLDAELSAYVLAEPDDALIRQVLESMPTPTPTLPRSKRPTSSKSFVWRQPRWWFSGVGLIGAGAVGVATGVLMMSLMTPALSPPSGEPAAVEQAYGGTAFSDAAPDGDDQ